MVDSCLLFESIAKTNTTHTWRFGSYWFYCLRVLLKQIQHTLLHSFGKTPCRLRVLLKQIQHTQSFSSNSTNVCLRVLLKQIQHTHHLQKGKNTMSLRVLLKQIQHTHFSLVKSTFLV